MIGNYFICYGDTVEQVENKVNAILQTSNSWSIVGGPIYTDGKWHQAIYKDRRVENFETTRKELIETCYKIVHAVESKDAKAFHQSITDLKGMI